jgi:hypothetical protein
MGDMEFGMCPYCKEEKPLNRKYYRYDIKCECHSPQHFEIVWYCKDCTPIEPIETKIHLSTEYLKEIEKILSRGKKIKRINENIK